MGVADAEGDEGGEGKEGQMPPQGEPSALAAVGQGQEDSQEGEDEGRRKLGGQGPPPQEPRQGGEERGRGEGAPKGADEGGKHEKCKKAIHREKVGRLDGEHRPGVEEGGEQGKALVQGVPPLDQGAKPDDAEEGEDVGEGRQASPQEVQTVVAVHAEKDGEGLGDRQRKRAVHEEVKALVVGVHGGALGVQVLPRGGGEGQGVGHHGQEALVRVEVASLVPLDPPQAHPQGQEHENQNNSPMAG